MTQVREDLCLFALIVEGEIKILASLYVDDIPVGFKTEQYENNLVAVLKAPPDTMSPL